MQIGDEETLAAIAREARLGRCLSQAELAERAGVSTKTVQRVEAGSPVAGSSRRSVLEALGLDPAAPLATAGAGRQRGESGARGDGHGSEGAWALVDAAPTLLRRLEAAERVDIEVDRDGWREAWRNRPWYRQGFYLATRDPVKAILTITDQLLEQGATTPGRRAKREDDLGKAIHDARKISWSLACRRDGHGALLLYIGSELETARRVGIEA